MKVFFSKLFKKIKNYNYRTKLLFVLYFVTLIPVLFLSIYNFNVVKKYIYDKEDAEININLSSIAYNIDSLFITVENLSDVVYLNENLYNMILNAQPSEVGEVYVRYIYPFLCLKYRRYNTYMLPQPCRFLTPHQ